MFRPTDDSSLNGSYRQNSEFFKTDERTNSISNDKSDNNNGLNRNQLLTWDTLKKIRRQKSCRLNSDLKKYQSSLCLSEQTPVNKLVSLRSEEERHFSSLNHNLKYEEIYRSSPSLRPVNSFNCHDTGGGRKRGGQLRNNNFTFSRQFSASALKFTGEEQ